MICQKCGCESDGKYCSNCSGALPLLSPDADNKQNGNKNPTLGADTCFSNNPAPTPSHAPSPVPAAPPDTVSQHAPASHTPGSRRYAGEPSNANAQASLQSDARSHADPSSSSKSEKRGASRKRSGGKARTSSGNMKTSDKQIRKELKQRDGRIHRLEEELSNLSLSQKQQNRRERTPQGDENGADRDFKDMAVKRAVGVTVFLSRIMQLVSFFLMVLMVYQLCRSFWSNGQNLGNINYMISERNYGLAVYVAFAGIALFFGFIWSIWILSKKDGGGAVRLKKYDTGRGFIPFLICTAIFFLVPIALEFIPSPEQITGLPQIPVDALVWQKAAMGLSAALSAVDLHRNTLILFSLSGALLSLIRRILRV